MSELDLIKERIAYLKVWIGILVVTDISVVGWLASNLDSTNTLLLVAGVISLVVITFGLYFLHRRIESLRDL